MTRGTVGRAVTGSHDRAVMPPPAFDLRKLWTLDQDVVFLNHGSFGACPRVVLEIQAQLRARMEAEPVRFFVREYEERMETARVALGGLVNAPVPDLVFVPNATTGVNAVLRSLAFSPGDELLVTDHAYNACANALRFVADRASARVVVVNIPFPITGPDVIIEAVLAATTERTRLALLDHITSPTGLILPIAELAGALAEQNVDVLVDGAHAPGMVPLDLSELGVAYYTANCHKWLCAPKGVGFLYVRPDRQATVRPVTISHGANSPRTDRSRFALEFDWTGTDDPTAAMSLPAAIEFMQEVLPGGLPAVMRHNHDLVVEGRAIVGRALGVEAPCPPSMLGSLASLSVPDADSSAPRSPLAIDPLQDALWEHDRIEVPVMTWPAPPRRLLRLSAQVYNTAGDYRRLAATLVELGVAF